MMCIARWPARKRISKSLSTSFLSVLLACGGAIAQTEEAPKGGWVEVRTNDQAYKSYLDRRSPHGFQFGVGLENFFPNGYNSKIDQFSFEELFGHSDLKFTVLQVGYRYNTSIGAFYLGADYGIASSLEDSRIGETRTVSARKMGLKANYIIDAITSEPYAVPYVGVSFVKFGFTEEALTQDVVSEIEAAPAIGGTVGILIQLNWLEKDMSRAAWLTSGMENTYIDIFMSKYNSTASGEELDTTSSFNWGAGLVIEF